jgi:flagellar biosynthesis/type III secretory pathway chaperone
MAITLDRSDFYVYLYKYPSGLPFYVGLGTGKRWRTHLYKARTGGKDYNSYKQNIIKKILAQGQEPIIDKVIDGIDREFAALIEQEVISKYKRRSEGGLLVNMTDGGDGIFVLDDVAEQRRRASLRAAECSTRFKKGVPSRNKGVPMSEETKEKCRQANLGNKNALGTKHTVQARANMSAAHKGYIGPMVGKKHTPEAIAKFLKTIRENPWTCPHCNKTGFNKGSGNRWHFDNCKLKEY